METIMGVLLGSVGLFYPFLLASVVIFIYAIIKRSWIWMSLSTILLYPDAGFLVNTYHFLWQYLFL